MASRERKITDGTLEVAFSRDVGLVVEQLGDVDLNGDDPHQVATAIVRARWSPARYAEMRNAQTRKRARLNSRKANGGTDGQGHARVMGEDGRPAPGVPEFLNENGRKRKSGTTRSMRRWHRVDSA
jgi:hypothetical protein